MEITTARVAEVLTDGGLDVGDPDSDRSVDVEARGDDVMVLPNAVDPALRKTAVNDSLSALMRVGITGHDAGMCVLVPADGPNA